MRNPLLARWRQQSAATNRAALTLGLVIILVMCSPLTAQILAGPQVRWWVSSRDMSRRLSSRPSLSFVPGETDERTLIQVDSQRTFQRIVGLGSSLEHSTCYNISRLPPARRAEVIESIVDAEKGIGMSLMRICIGTPDFTASPWYSYDDMPAGHSDPELKHFSIDKDREYVLPVLKLALAENPGLRFFASPWSPPGWMKTNDSLCGGRIDAQHFPALAQYLARFVEAYEAEGIRIHALTPQNEPGYFPGSYPTCGWTAAQQRDFIRDHLGPEFQRRGTPTKIWCYDHNFNNVRFPMTILSDPETARYVDGTAFHHYEGKPSAMTQLHSEFPDKHVYFAEGSVFGIKGARQIIEFLRHWACSYNAWVTIIDHTGQPNPGPHGCSPTCIVLNSDTLKLDYRFDYYMYGQFMRYIRPGAMRIQSDVPSKSLPNVAVRNRDGSIVLVVANLKSEPVSFGIRWAGRHATAQLDGESIATFRWLSH